MKHTLHKRSPRKAFSLVELIIVVVIIGIIAAIAIPRMSRGAAGGGDSALSGNLAGLRSALDLYATEHGNSFPSVANFAAQLTEYSDSSGMTAATQSSTIVYGPYLRKVPPLPVGPPGYKNTNTVIDGSTGTVGGTAGAWFYNPTTGAIEANLASTYTDVAGNPYNGY